MRVASILCKDFSTTHSQIIAALPFCDVIELRLDYLSRIDIAAIKQLRDSLTLPVIFTLRTQAQGGQCAMPDTERFPILQQLAALSPDYLDLEFDTPAEFVLSLQKKYPALQIIGSYHDFEKTPADLRALFHKIYKPHFTIFKIATFAHNICDTLRLLIFLQQTSQTHRIIGMAMGEYGQSSRILSLIVGSLMSYGSVDTTSAAAPGQLTVQEMTDVYHAHTLNHHTTIYALLGDPIIQSPGHLFHNQVFTQKNNNAVYVKLKVEPVVLKETLDLLKQLPFAGFSVTIPHKESICTYVETTKHAKAIGAINTIKLENGKYVGFNTDSMTAKDVLEKQISLREKDILILGAGGSAKAITHTLVEAGANITLCNRTISRAQQLAEHYACHAIDFTTLFALKKLPYHIIINTLPADAFVAQCGDWKIPPPFSDQSIAMDIVLKPLDTLFLQLTREAGYACIAGDVFYKAQARRQLEIWFS